MIIPVLYGCCLSDSGRPVQQDVIALLAERMQQCILLTVTVELVLASTPAQKSSQDATSLVLMVADNVSRDRMSDTYSSKNVYL